MLSGQFNEVRLVLRGFIVKNCNHLSELGLYGNHVISFLRATGSRESMRIIKSRLDFLIFNMTFKVTK